MRFRPSGPSQTSSPRLNNLARYGVVFEAHKVRRLEIPDTFERPSLCLGVKVSALLKDFGGFDMTNEHWYVQPAITAIGVGVNVTIGIVIYILTNLRNAQKDRTTLTVEIWKKWSSGEMRQVRVAVGQVFNKSEHGEMIFEKIRYDAIVSMNSEMRVNFGTMEHFIIEVSQLKRRKLLDKKLFVALFHDTLQFWEKRFDAVEYETNVTDPSYKRQSEGRDIQRQLKEAFRILLN